jgi:hypothetical protein
MMRSTMVMLTPLGAWWLVRAAGGWDKMTRRRRIGWTVWAVFMTLTTDSWWATLTVGAALAGLAVYGLPSDDDDDGQGGGRLGVTMRLPAWRARGGRAWTPRAV